jgi:hypothetical protein
MTLFLVNSAIYNAVPFNRWEADGSTPCVDTDGGGEERGTKRRESHFNSPINSSHYTNWATRLTHWIVIHQSMLSIKERKSTEDSGSSWTFNYKWTVFRSCKESKHRKKCLYEEKKHNSKKTQQPTGQALLLPKQKKKTAIETHSNS